MSWNLLTIESFYLPLTLLPFSRRSAGTNFWNRLGEPFIYLLFYTPSNAPRTNNQNRWHNDMLSPDIHAQRTVIWSWGTIVQLGGTCYGPIDLANTVSTSPCEYIRNIHADATYRSVLWADSNELMCLRTKFWVLLSAREIRIKLLTKSEVGHYRVESTAASLCKSFTRKGFSQDAKDVLPAALFVSLNTAVRRYYDNLLVL